MTTNPNELQPTTLYLMSDIVFTYEADGRANMVDILLAPEKVSNSKTTHGKSKNITLVRG